MFTAGDKVIYPGHGLAEVMGLEEKKIGGQTLSFFNIKIEETGARVLIPLAKADHVGLRRPIGRGEIRQVMETLKDHSVVLDRQAWVRRFRGYQEKIRTGVATELAEVFRDLMLLRCQKTLSFGERRVLDDVRRMLVAELAHVRQEPAQKIQHTLEGFFITAKPAAA